MQASDTELMLRGYGLTTAEIYYRMPDYRNVLNTFLWQHNGYCARYPELFRFIEFWQGNIEGPLHSVRFTHRKLIGPGEWRHVVKSTGCTDLPRGRSDRDGLLRVCLTYALRMTCVCNRHTLRYFARVGRSNTFLPIRLPTRSTISRAVMPRVVKERVQLYQIKRSDQPDSCSAPSQEGPRGRWCRRHGGADGGRDRGIKEIDVQRDMQHSRHPCGKRVQEVAQGFHDAVFVDHPHVVDGDVTLQHRGMFGPGPRCGCRTCRSGRPGWARGRAGRHQTRRARRYRPAGCHAGCPTVLVSGVWKSECASSTTGKAAGPAALRRPPPRQPSQAPANDRRRG